MIKNVKAANFFSFKESAEISFEMNKNCPEDISKGKDYTTALCVMGPNASGKTNLLKVIPFIGIFCCTSVNFDHDAEIPVTPFMDNDQESTLFSIEFQYNGYKYLYDLEVDRKEVIYEAISRGKEKYRLVVERDRGKVIPTTKEFQELKAIPNLRKNASIISIANMFGMTCLKEIGDFFQTIVTNVTGTGLMETPPTHKVSSYYNEDPTLFNKVKKFIMENDTGVSDIRLQGREIVDANGKRSTIFEPVFSHTSEGKSYELHYLFESSGTRELYCKLIHYFETLICGGVLVLDELDLHIHPMLLPKLLDLFLNEETNSKGAQILYTCHTLEVMDLMKKYRTMFVQKEDNKSFNFRLDEIPGSILRNDKEITPLYRRGVIGGVPRV